MTQRTSLAPFSRPKLRRLLTAQLMADVGDGIVRVALPLYVNELRRRPPEHDAPQPWSAKWNVGLPHGVSL